MTSTATSARPAPQPTYTPDVLGEPFEACTIALHRDLIAGSDEAALSDVVATLVRAGAPKSTRAVLYVHGFADYFFQAEHALRLAREGDLDFYGLDLRRYGRSLRPGQVTADIRSLAEYDEELTRALEIIRGEGHRQVILLGHSTGGLIAALFAARHPRAIDALVLNSPWFDLNASALRRLTSTPIAATVATRTPTRQIARMDPAYGRSIHRSTGGEWDFDLVLKPLEGFPVRAAWLRAIRRGHRQVNAGLHLRLPVLMCSSSRSGGRAGAHPNTTELAGADCVLDVAHMWRAVPTLGENVTLHTIPGGRHDLALSAAPARAAYERTVLTWIADTFDGGARRP